MAPLDDAALAAIAERLARVHPAGFRPGGPDELQLVYRNGANMLDTGNDLFAALDDAAALLAALRRERAETERLRTVAEAAHRWVHWSDAQREDWTHVGHEAELAAYEDTRNALAALPEWGAARAALAGTGEGE